MLCDAPFMVVGLITDMRNNKADLININIYVKNMYAQLQLPAGLPELRNRAFNP
jgi:hypothetical protein